MLEAPTEWLSAASLGIDFALPTHLTPIMTHGVSPSSIWHL